MPDEQLILTLSLPYGTVKKIQDGDTALAEALKGQVGDLVSKNLITKENVSSLALNPSEDGKTVINKPPAPPSLEPAE
jgi:hypothetical protein